MAVALNNRLPTSKAQSWPFHFVFLTVRMASQMAPSGGHCKTLAF